MILFFTVFMTMFIAEMGDKTQFLLIAMASKYRIRNIIIGTACAMVTLNLIAVGVGSFIHKLIPAEYIKMIAGIAFLGFACSIIADSGVKKSNAREERNTSSGHKITAAIFFTFFLAELGDKTQLTAITFAADCGMENAVIVFSACTLGLFSADMLGLTIGYLLRKRIPEKAMSVLSFFIFTGFGIYTVSKGAALVFTGTNRTMMMLLAIYTVFAAVCVFFIYKRYRITGRSKSIYR